MNRCRWKQQGRSRAPALQRCSLLRCVVFLLLASPSPHIHTLHQCNYSDTWYGEKIYILNFHFCYFKWNPNSTKCLSAPKKFTCIFFKNKNTQEYKKNNFWTRFWFFFVCCFLRFPCSQTSLTIQSFPSCSFLDLFVAFSPAGWCVLLLNVSALPVDAVMRKLLRAFWEVSTPPICLCFCRIDETLSKIIFSEKYSILR